MECGHGHGQYQYETFNGLPVYYGGDMYDSDDLEEFFPDTSEETNNMMWNQSRPDGGDNNSVNTVNMTPRCRTVSDEPRREVIDCTADEYSETSKMDTADLDDTDCQLETDVWDDMYCPVWISDSSMVNSVGQTEQLLLNKGEVACMIDFDDEDFNDTGFDSDTGSGMEYTGRRIYMGIRKSPTRPRYGCLHTRRGKGSSMLQEG